MRGKQISFERVELFHRITPAYAGKTAFVCFGSYTIRDHPRVCGENHQIVINSL